MTTRSAPSPAAPPSSARHTNVLPAEYLLDEYRIEAVLGVGGFGVTYKGLDTHLNTWVAIKEYFPVEWSFRDADGVMVHPNTQGMNSASNAQISDYQWGLERFLDEARVLARIQHPYVVRVKRYFCANGTAYIVMDYEEGQPLSAILTDGETLTEPEVRGLLEDVVPALRAVHEQGYLHRDIKPANLYVRAHDQRVILIDFGAARMTVGRRSQSITSMVTPGYSPPEQYTTRNDRYGTWTDIYALGAVLYRCVTGHTPTEAAERLLDDQMEPAVEAGAGRYSTNLLRVIDRALAVRPELRFRDVAEMEAALASLPREDSDETVIMAPVVKTGQLVEDPPSRAVRRGPPAAAVGNADDDGLGLAPRPASPVSDSGRQDLLPLAARQAVGRSRRASLPLVGGGAVLAAAVIAGILWLWPSTPTPQPPVTPHPGLEAQSPTLQPPPVVATPAPAPTEAAPPSTAYGAPFVSAATPNQTAAPAAAPEPAPATATQGQPSRAEPTALPILFRDTPVVAQPVPSQQATPKAVAPSPVAPISPPVSPVDPVAPPLAVPASPPKTPDEATPVAKKAVERSAVQKAELRKKAAAREVVSTQDKKSRKKTRRSRASAAAPVVEPITVPKQSAPIRTSNPWDAPASTGFNQK